MHELFFLDIEFKGNKVCLEGWLQIWDYQHHIEIQINDTTVIFELGETLQYGVLNERQQQYPNKLNPELLHLIAQRLTLMFNADCNRSCN